MSEVTVFRSWACNEDRHDQCDRRAPTSAYGVSTPAYECLCSCHRRPSEDVR